MTESSVSAPNANEAADWKTLIQAAIVTRPAPVKAQTYGGKKWGTSTAPVLLRCDDGRDYVVKGKQRGRELISEQVVAALGRLVNGPIRATRLVDVPDELIKMQRELGHLHPGIGHGCEYVADGVEQKWISHTDEPENKLRHCSLAILYGWVHPGDNQLHYQLGKPRLVWSVDHGHFKLTRKDKAAPNPQIMGDAKLKLEDLSPLKPILEAIKKEAIASAVASPHETWPFDINEMVQTAEHLEKNRLELIASIP